MLNPFVKQWGRTALVLLPILQFVGCQDATTSTPAVGNQPSATTDVRETEPVVATPPGHRAATHDEAVTFAETFSTAVHDGDLAGINALINWHAIFVESTNDIPASDEIREAFVETSMELTSRGGMAEMFVKASNGGGFRVLNVRAVGQEMTILFRMIQPTGGLNYCEVPVVTTASGETLANDICIYSQGDWMSNTARETFELGALNESDKWNPTEIDQYIEHHDELLDMLRAVKNGECERALEIYGEMPPVVQNDRKTLIVRVQAASRLDEERHLAAIEDFCAKYPDDPAADLHAIQGHLLAERYDLALEGIDRIDRKVGGDPYLDVMRADACYNAGELHEAKRFAQRAADAEPELEGAYWLLVNSSLELKKFSDTLEPLSVLEQQFGVEIDDETFAEFPDFVESDEYQDWKEKRSLRAAEGSPVTDN